MMLADLLDEKIQPERIDVHNLPEIIISDSLREKLQKVLEEEVNNYVHVFERTAIVQRGNNYIFFSSHWLYLAVLCKNYAEALKPYGDFFDQTIKGNREIIQCFSMPDSEFGPLKDLIPDDTDRERMIKYVKGGSDYRPGKSLINGESVRSTKDIFASCVLKTIDVPDESTIYLGYLIYYLTQRPVLYESVEKEILKQLGAAKSLSKLSSTVKDCAKDIVDVIYTIDQFKRLSERIEKTDKCIKINTSYTDGLLPNGNWLRYMFALPNSDMYNSKNAENKTRVFETEYIIKLDGENLKCKLTTEWVGTEITEQSQPNNYLRALIKLVNKYYEDVIEIKEEAGEYYLNNLKQHFSLMELPGEFDNPLSKRYIKSLLAKPFVILTGNSGTGKTRIAKQFAEYLEVKLENGQRNWLLVPVGADWTDNTKILGFYNPLANEGKGDYVETKILKLVKLAIENSTIPFFIILDEMNLSHVELYFADFLSHMETPDVPFVLDGHQGNIKYPANLFIVGTVNIDETTYMFSPKVLDRANVIEFKPNEEEVLDLLTPADNNASSDADKGTKGTAEAFVRLAEKIRDGKGELAADELSTVREIFKQIYQILEKYGFEFAYRTVKEIRRYISAAYELSASKDDFKVIAAVDEQVLQKVLPKIHGSQKEIGVLLKELKDNCEGNQLKLSLEKINKMIDKLERSQYASFI